MTEQIEYDWSPLTHEAEGIIEQLEEDEVEVNYIAGIARGGLPIGVYLSHRLDVPMRYVDASHYVGKERKNLVDVEGIHLDGVESGDTILLFDDIVDTGKTMKRVLRDVKTLKPQNFDVVTASLHVKPHREFEPDYWIWETDDWVIYPWE